ncbi:MAG: glutamine synthetase family protein [Sporichthyaceae bacterium]
MLRRVVQRCTGLGFTARIGYELEFHLFADDPTAAAARSYADLAPIAPGVRTYGLARLATLEPILGPLLADLAAAGIEVEAANPEFGAGQFELNLPAADPLAAADTAVRFKHAVREIAAAGGMSATIMARWDTGASGSSGHVHQSLWREGANVFADEERTRDAYVAGLLATMAELTPVFCPNPNSYKRTVPGSFAPTTATWGVDNRTTALRVVEEGAAARVEHRLPGADANPYLVVAACLAGGLYGIEQDLQAPTPIPGNGYTASESLPGSLEAALRAAESGKLLAELLGAEFAEHYLAIRRAELTASQMHVTEWERVRYFELA